MITVAASSRGENWLQTLYRPNTSNDVSSKMPKKPQCFKIENVPQECQQERILSSAKSFHLQNSSN